MKFEKNSVIGMVLLGLLLFGYFYFTRQAQVQLEVKQKQVQDSLAAIAPIAKDTIGLESKADSTNMVSVIPGSFQQSGVGIEKLVTLENDLVAITFSNKGGQPKTVKLKKYKSGDSSDVKLSSSEFSSASGPIQKSTIRGMLIQGRTRQVLQQLAAHQRCHQQSVNMPTSSYRTGILEQFRSRLP